VIDLVTRIASTVNINDMVKILQLERNGVGAWVVTIYWK